MILIDKNLGIPRKNNDLQIEFCVKMGKKISKCSSLIAASALIIAIVLVATTCLTYEIKGGPLSGKNLSDGIFQGDATYGPVRIKAEVTIEDGSITDIKLMRHFQGLGRKAEQPVIKRIIRDQSTDVDAVTGATGSSIAIMNAVEKAVSKAKK